MSKDYKNTFLISTILAFLYFFAGKFSLLFLHGTSIVNIGVFISEGIALGFTLYFGKKVVAGIFIGQFFLAYSNDISIIYSLGIALINSLEALLGFYLFNTLKLNINLQTFKDIFGLSAIILFIQLISASLANILLLMDGIITHDGYLLSSFSWWFGNIMGQLLFTPYLLLFFSHYKKIDFLNYFFYMLFFTFFIYFIEVILDITNAMLLLSISLPFILLIVAHKGFTYATSMNVILAFISSYSVYLGNGAFNSADVANNVINYNLYILAHISMILITGVLFEERKRNILLLENRVSEELHKNKEQEILLLKQSRLAQMGEMIAMIAHQWRQPLNNLSLSNQLLISKYNKNKLDDVAMDMFKNNSKKQITHMSKTIDDFRNFFKPDQQKQNFVVNDVIRELIQITGGVYEANRIEVIFSYEKDFYTYGYPNELGQAILNIINNAKDALVEKDQEVKTITITLTSKDEDICIAIEDNAGGIPEDIIDKIFDPYFSTKESKNGTGLGLYMSKMIIIDKIDGKIFCKNAKNGARFEIYIKEVENVS